MSSAWRAGEGRRRQRAVRGGMPTRTQSSTVAHEAIFVDASEPLTISKENVRPALVLVASDQEWSARSLETLLNPYGYAVLRATGDRQVVRLVLTTHPDAIILEHRQPNLDATAVCQMLREDERFNVATPIIVVCTSPMERAQRLALYGAGAWDMWTHPVDSEVLLRQLRTFIMVKRLLDRTRDASLLDTTTGLYSARGLAQRARELGAGAQRRHEALACVALRLELEPPIAEEDAATHALADAAQALGTEWMRSARVNDVLGHLGHAEFGILASGTDEEGTERLLQRLRERMEAIPITVEGVPHQIRVRAQHRAVADYATAATDALELLRQASRMLHRSLSEPSEDPPLDRSEAERLAT